MSNGCILIDRSVLHHPLVGLHNPKYCCAWLWMLTEARWKSSRKEIGGAIINLERGQFVHSLRFMAKGSGLSLKELRLFLKKLEFEKMIAKKGTIGGGGGTIITVCNYNIYQDMKEYRDMIKGTTGARQGHDKGTTGAQTRIPDAMPDAMPEGGLSKTKPKTKPKTYMTEEWELTEEYILIGEKKNIKPDVVKIEADKFKNYHLEKGSKFISWPKAFSTWLGRAKEYNPSIDKSSPQKSNGQYKTKADRNQDSVDKAREWFNEMQDKPQPPKMKEIN